MTISELHRLVAQAAEAASEISKEQAWSVDLLCAMDTLEISRALLWHFLQVEEQMAKEVL